MKNWLELRSTSIFIAVASIELLNGSLEPIAIISALIKGKKLLAKISDKGTKTDCY
ncbi:MAG: hypothetical protein ACI87J_002591 [Colwellia sp.]|jgi:hypothetical protein